MRNPFRPLGHAFKSVSRMVFGRSSQMFGPGWGWVHGLSRSDYQPLHGDGSHNSIVQAQFRWISDSFPEAEMRVRRRGDKQQLDPVNNHPLVELLDTPNPFYSSLTLFDVTYCEWRRGNAYWIVLKNAQGRPVQLWWAPSAMMEPAQGDDPGTFIDHYEYRPRPERDAIRLEITDVVHFRNGLDPKYPQKGSSDLDCLLREIFTDDEAASWSSTLLANGAGPHVLISGDDDDGIDELEADQIKTNYLQKTTGDHRGEPLIVSGRTKMQVMSFNPQEMDLKNLRRVPEERISAVIGVPAVVCGLGAGLDRSTYNNMKEAKESATENVLIPAWRFFAREIQRQLMPQFADPRRDVFDFDLSTVRALQDDQNALWKRLDDALKSGAITLNQSLEGRGMETIGPSGDVYYMPINVTPTTPDLIGTPPAPPTAPQSGVTPADAQPAKMLQFKDDNPDAWLLAIDRLRAHLEPVGTSEMSRYLRDQQSRAVANLTSSSATATQLLDWEAEDARLTTALHPTYMRALSGTTDLMRQYVETDLTVDDATVRAYLRTAGQQIKGINATTRRLIQEALAEGQALDEDIGQLARRIQQLTGFNASRAEMIAVTELGSSTALATTHAAQLAGVKAMQIHDPDGNDHGFTGCTDRHGRVVTTIEAFGVGLLHPRCRVVLVPVTRAPVTQRSNGHAALVTA